MIPDDAWFKKQSEHNKNFYKWLHANRPDLADWKAVALFYSALHRINWLFKTRTGRAPRNHAARLRRVWNEAPRAYDDYRAPYALSMRARYCEGHRMTDDSRILAVKLLARLEKEVPFR